MRIIVIDSDKTFTTSFSQRCQKLSVYCQVIPAVQTAFAEMKKKPDDVDLVLISKELADGQDGAVLAQMMRKDPKTADIPYVLMSTTWGKPEFAKHQKTEFGANAYYNKKSAISELESTIEAVTGFKFAAPPTGAKPASTGNTSLNIKLEAASDVVNISEELPDDISMSEPISLFADGEAPPPAPPKPAAPMITQGMGAPPAKKPAAPAAAPPKPAAAAPSAPAPSIDSGGGIELSFGGAEEVHKIENGSGAPQATTPESSTGGIDINLGGDFQVETSTPKPTKSAPPAAAPPKAAAPVAKAAPASPSAINIPTPAAETPQTEGSLFAIDLMAGEDIPAEVPPPTVAHSVAEAAPEAGGAPELTIAPDIGISFGEEPAVVAEPAFEAPIAEASEPVFVAPPAPPASEMASIDFSAGAVEAAELAAAPPPPVEEPVFAAPIDTSARPVPVSEEEAAKDLPYLFAGGAAGLAAGAGGHAGHTTMTRSGFSPQNSGHARAHVESGGPLSEDVETLKKYLTMREQDVSVLTAQLTYAKEELDKGENTIKRLSMENEDLYHQINDLKKRVETQDQ